MTMFLELPHNRQSSHHIGNDSEELGGGPNMGEVIPEAVNDLPGGGLLEGEGDILSGDECITHDIGQDEAGPLDHGGQTIGELERRGIVAVLRVREDRGQQRRERENEQGIEG